MSAKRVAPIGYYGESNFGDDLFQATVIAQAQYLWPSAVVHSNQTPVRFRVSRWLLGFKTVASGQRLIRAFRRMVWAKTIAICGGSLYERMTLIKRMYGSWSALPGREVEALGVSIGPFSSPDDESSVVAYLRRHKRVVVRDWKSKAIADRYGIPASMGGDIAALHPILMNADRIRVSGFRDPDPSVFRIAIVPHIVSSESFLTYLTGIVQFVEEVASRCAVSVRVLCLNSHADVGDRIIAERVIQELTERGYMATMFTHSTACLDDSLEELARAHTVVSTRLHGSIAAYLLGVPFVSLNYHEKCSEFCEDVGVAQELRIGSSSGPESYRAAALALFSGAASPSMSPGVYVERASSAYFGE